MKKALPPPSASKQRLIWARKVDDITARVKQKIEVLSGFKDVGGQVRYCENFFMFFDKSNSGFLNFSQVCIALKKLNFLGCHREIEAWFNYYDDDFTGMMNYSAFANDAYGTSKDARPHFDFSGIAIIEDVREKMVDIGGASGFYELSRLLNLRKCGADGSISRMELADCLQQYGIDSNACSDVNMSLLQKAFDPLHNNKVDVAAFLASLIKGTMSYERKLIVKETFHRFRGAQDMGYVSVGELVSHMIPSYHPEVIAGLLSEDYARDQFRLSFSQGEESEGYATFAEYLDYFKGVSLGIGDDHAFDMFMRNVILFAEDATSGAMDQSMALSSSPTLRRLLVTHSDGKQEVVELVDEMGVGRFDVATAKDKVREQGCFDVKSIKI